MTTEHEQRIKSRLAASSAAAAAGNIDAADQHWRTYVGLIEVDMKRTGAVEHLTPAPNKDADLK